MSQTRKNFSIFTLAIVLTFILFYLMFSATWVGATGGLLAGSFMAGLTALLGLVSYGIQYQRQKSALASKHKSVDDNASHQTRTIEIDTPFKQAFTIALDTLKTLDGQDIPKTRTGIPSKQRLKIRTSDAEIGRIEAGLQAKTLGIQDFTDFSTIHIQLQRLDTHTTRLQIDSAPTSSLETLDLGRHTHYVNLLARNIRLASQELLAEAHLTDKAVIESIYEDEDSVSGQSNIEN